MKKFYLGGSSAGMTLLLLIRQNVSAAWRLPAALASSLAAAVSG